MLEDINQNPSNQDMLNCIQHSSISWRAVPQDPFIYVSFSFEQLKNAYSEDVGHYLSFLKTKGASDFSQSQIREFRKLIRQEWMERANFPVKFLSSNTCAEDVKRKNVVFIFSQPMTAQGQSTNLFEENATFKIISLPNFEGPVTKNHKNTMLHETGHAFIDLKHNKHKDAQDAPPYCEMSCTSSVIIYLEDCTKTDMTKALLALPPESREDPMNVIAEMTLDKLSTLDIEAAHIFKANWLQKKVGLPRYDMRIVEQENSLRKLQAQMDELANSWLYTIVKLPKKALNIVQNYLSDYVQSVVSECPSYFGPDDITSIRNEHLFRPELIDLPDGQTRNFRISNSAHTLFALPASNNTLTSSIPLRLGF